MYPWTASLLNLTTTGRHIIPCGKCGAHYVVLPPRTEYISTMRDPCPRVDYQKSFYDCITCSHRNIFYWHNVHETALECETANCTCCSNKDHDVNVVKDEQEIEEMKTVKKFE